jgi:ATP-dependent RNA helicase DeaD
LDTFKKLGLSQEILTNLEQLGFEKPTPVQEQAIPALLKDESTDFIGIAQTGTGKTAAFGLPLIERINAKNRNPQALIMAPTRELGQQIATQLVSFSRGIKDVNIEVVYGGASIVNQIRALKRATQIVVATPGRLLDLIKRKAISLEEVKYVVLDEADEMLNMGFKEDIDKILSFTLEERVTWLFSATMPPEIRKIVKKYMDAPQEVSVNTEEKVNKDIDHQFVITQDSNKLAAIRRFMDIQPEMRGIMFCRTKRETQKISDDLGEQGYGVEALHGDLSQAQRDSVMRRFKTRAMQLLIATDVAARGIDVDDLTHVLHHKLPDQLEAYTHRSGRTGRIGKKGISLAFINSRESHKVSNIEKKNKIKFTKIEIPSVENLRSSRITHWANLIINTKVDKQADDILKDLDKQFEHLSKEDILKRLITSQLDHLTAQGGIASNLNEKPKAAKTKERERIPAAASTTTNRYFINIGLIDGVTKGDLMHFLSDVTGIKRKFITDVSMQKNCAFFDVDKQHESKLSGKFEGLEIDGREVRVNRDDDAKRRQARSSSGGDGYDRSSKGSRSRRPQQGKPFRDKRSKSRPGNFAKKRRK